MIKDFDTAIPEEFIVSIDRDIPEITEITQAVSDYLFALPLPREQYDKLIVMLAAHVSAIEKNGFIQGFGLGVASMQYPKE